MSQENVETVRLLYDLFNRRDFDEALQYYDPEMELHPGVLAPDQATRFFGREGMKEFIQGAIAPWKTVTVEPQEILETADNRILSVDRWLFRGRDGIEIERELPTAYVFRDGLIVRIDGFTDKAGALAVGLQQQTMSQENVEIVRKAFEGFAAGGVEGAVASFAPDVVLFTYPEWPGPSEYRGHDGLRALMAEWTDNFEEFELVACELRQLRDRVLMLGETVGRIKGSGVPIRQQLGAVYWDFRDGQIGETRNYLTWREALEAVGLTE